MKITEKIEKYLNEKIKTEYDLTKGEKPKSEVFIGYTVKTNVGKGEVLDATIDDGRSILEVKINGKIKKIDSETGKEIK